MNSYFKPKTIIALILISFLSLLLFLAIYKSQDSKTSPSVKKFETLLANKNEILIDEEMKVHGDGAGKTIITIDDHKKIQTTKNGSLELSNLTIKTTDKGSFVLTRSLNP